MSARIYTGAEAAEIREIYFDPCDYCGGQGTEPNDKGDGVVPCDECNGRGEVEYEEGGPPDAEVVGDLAASVEHHAARAERAEAERDAAIKRATNAERMRDAFVATSVAFAVDMIDKPDAMARCAAERDAALSQAEELTRALQEAREAIAAIARGDVPFCEECGNGETLAMQWDDEGNPVCDTHSGGIVCRRDVVGAGAIRAALTAVPTEAPRG